MLQQDASGVAKSIADALAQRIICGELLGGFALARWPLLRSTASVAAPCVRHYYYYSGAT